jgi:asparagine N-glycosylation enzyme membrane subunit Stt3
MPEEDKNHGKTLTSWHFPDFIPYKRSRNWYIVAGLIGLGLIIWAFVTINYLFAVIIIMFAVILFFQNRIRPKQILFEITEDGLTAGESFFEWNSIKNFWIVYHPPEVKKLFFDFKSTFRPALGIQLFDQNPLKIREILKKYIDEDIEREDEPTSDAINRLFKLG